MSDNDIQDVASLWDRAAANVAAVELVLDAYRARKLAQGVEVEL